MPEPQPGQLGQQLGGGPRDEHMKDMQVCEVCGALLVVGDVQQRVDEHLLGKQHIGYAQIRSYITARREATRVGQLGSSFYFFLCHRCMVINAMVCDHEHV